MASIHIQENSPKQKSEGKTRTQGRRGEGGKGEGGGRKSFFLGRRWQDSPANTICFYPGAVPPGWFIFNTTATRRKPKLKGKYHEIVYRGFFFSSNLFPLGSRFSPNVVLIPLSNKSRHYKNFPFLKETVPRNFSSFFIETFPGVYKLASRGIRIILIFIFLIESRVQAPK